MASGDVLDRFFPPGEPPASGYATFDTRNAHPVLDFDDTVDEYVCWTSILPANYAGGGFTVRIYWSATSATTGNCMWAVAMERIDDGGLDTDADSFAATQTTTVAPPATSGVVKYSEIYDLFDGANSDSVAVNDLFRLKVLRLGSNGTDTMAGDAELHAVELRET